MTLRSHSTPALAAALGDAEERAWTKLETLAPSAVFATSRTTDTSVVEIEGLGRAVRKRWAWPRRRDRLKGALRTTWAARSPARREFEALVRLAALPDGPFAPVPLGYAERRERGVLRACVLVTQEIAGAVDLAHWLASARAGAKRRQILDRIATRTREMHDAGLADFEMHPRNVLVVAETGSVFKVDCAKQRRRRGPASGADRARDLAALDVGLTRLATPAERERFFLTYGTSGELASAVRRELSRIDARESRRLP